MTHGDEVRYFTQRSKEFLETAKYQISMAFYGLAVFSLEQTLQLYPKIKNVS